MKTTYKVLFINSFLMLSVLNPVNPLRATEEDNVRKNIIAQAQECAKNSAMEWNSSINRCVLKKKDHEARSESIECSQIKDQAAREKCHLQLAEKETGLSADTGKLYDGKTDRSAVLNTAATAVYGVNLWASSGTNSRCTSVHILGGTAIVGLITDIFLKKKAKDKINELEKKYKLDQISDSYEAQMTAFQYLKEEQQTVREIASLEKKRNMLLTAGYLSATLYAVYELATTQGTTQGTCASKASGAEETAKSGGGSFAKTFGIGVLGSQAAGAVSSDKSKDNPPSTPEKEE